MACGSCVQYCPIFDALKVEVGRLEYTICRLRISIFAGVNMKSLPFVPLELEWHFAFVFLNRVITLKLINVIYVFGIAQGSHTFFSLGFHCACKITLLFVCAVLYVALLESLGNQGNICGGGRTRFVLYNI